ncbi:MAG: hypothetical protein V1914_03085 [archaeon]
MKRGQATIFVIMGILIVALVTVSYSYRDEISSKASEFGLVKTASLPPQFENTKTEIENCLSDRLADATETIAIRGGFMEPTNALDANGLLITYFYNKGNKFPPRERIAAEISRVFNLDAVLCPTVADLEKPKMAESEVTIEESKIGAKITMPVTLKIGETAETIKDFSITPKISLGKLLDAAEQIIQTVNSEGICINCVNSIAEEKDIEAEIEPFENSVIITLIDQNSKINSKPLKLSFAVKY